MPAARIAMVRLLVGLYGCIYLVVRLPHFWSYGLDDLDRFVPVGVVAWADAPMLPELYRAILLVTVALSFSFFLGVRHRVLAPTYALGLLFCLTHSNSWGKILHTDNLFLLYVIVLAAAPSADALSRDALRRQAKGTDPPPEDGRHGWPIRLMTLVCAVAYLLAGIAKLKNSGLDFAQGDTLRNYVAFDNLRKLQLGSVYSPIGAWLLPYAGFFSMLAWVSYVLELMAPLVCFWRRAGRVWCVLVWGFHFGVLVLMAISFAFQLTFIAFAPFFDVEKLATRKRVKALLERLRLVPAQTG
ncbi:MAG: HTTM domain-containing protein [Myxococcota bacterium]